MCIENSLARKYGDVKLTIGKQLEYLEMDLDYLVPGMMNLHDTLYIKIDHQLS